MNQVIFVVPHRNPLRYILTRRRGADAAHTYHTNETAPTHEVKYVKYEKSRRV